jgi:integrase
MTSPEIYTRALHSLWEFFVEKKYAAANIVTAVTQEKKEADPIPLNDLSAILEALQADEKHPECYHLVVFMVLTGCRPSTAIMQTRENIDFAEGVVRMENVKVSKKRQRSFYYFPLHAGLRALFSEMGVGPGSVGRLFPEFPVVENHMTQPLRPFWDTLNQRLAKEDLIRSQYTLKQIRPTFVSYAVNVLRMNPYEVQKLVDHSDIKLTTAVYLKYEIQALTPALDRINLSDKKVLQSVLQSPEGEPVTETEAVQVLE